MSLNVTWDEFSLGILPPGRTDKDIATLTVLHALREAAEDGFVNFAVLYEHFGIAGIQDAVAEAASKDPTVPAGKLLAIADWDLVETLLREGAQSLRDFFRETGQEALIDDAYASTGYPFSSVPGASFRRYVASQVN